MNYRKPAAIAALCAAFLFSLVVQGQQDAVELTRDQRIAIQHGLAELGYDQDSADGLFGNNTRAAIWDWQNAVDGGSATGYLTKAQADTLIEAGTARMQSLGLTLEGGQAESVNPIRADERVMHFAMCEDEDSYVDGEGCWVRFTHPEGCQAWTSIPETTSEYTLTWSGDCIRTDSIRVAHGRGELEASDRNDAYWDYIAEGNYGEGFQQGLWVTRWANGQVRETPHADGKRHGTEVHRWPADDEIYEKVEIPWVDGKRHGTEIWRFADGGSIEIPYTDGKLHGTEVWRFPDGQIGTETYDHGKLTDCGGDKVMNSAEDKCVWK